VKTGNSGHPVLDNLQPGTWYEVSNSHLADSAVEPPLISQSLYDTIHGNIGVRALTDAWSGGAYDTSRRMLLLWGGGHGDYGGNEVYGFDVATMTWMNLTLPSSSPGGDILPDGRPGARHTYSGLQYAPPPVDRMLAYGNYTFPHAGGSDRVFTFDPAGGDACWSQLPSLPLGAQNGYSAYDTNTGTYYVHSTHYLLSIKVAGVDPSQRKWKQLGTSLDWFRGGTLAIDTKRHKMVRIGNGHATIWDLDASGTPRSDLQTTGDTEIEAQAEPGLVYDPKADRMVAWAGGGNVYTLNMDTLKWTCHQPAGDNTVTPDARQNPSAEYDTGTFGRFRYMPAYDAFILVASANRNVYFYRLPNL